MLSCHVDPKDCIVAKFYCIKDILHTVWSQPLLEWIIINSDIVNDIFQDCTAELYFTYVYFHSTFDVKLKMFTRQFSFLSESLIAVLAYFAIFNKCSASLYSAQHLSRLNLVLSRYNIADSCPNDP